MLLARWSNIYHCLLENVQAPIYKNLRFEHFETLEPTTIYMI